SRSGLPCDGVNWVIEDDDRSVWLDLPCGLVRVARASMAAWLADPSRTIDATLFDSADGMRTESIPTGAAERVARSSDGRLWFTGLDGLNVVDPRHLAVNRLPPPVRIEQVVADRRTYEGLAGGTIRLPARTRDLEVDYTALSLVAPEKNRFRVKLE